MGFDFEISFGNGIKKSALFFCAFFSALFALAQIDDANSQSASSMTLQKAIDSALKTNLKLVYERYNPEIAKQNLEIAKAEYDPRFNFSTGYSARVQPLASSALDGSTKPESDAFNYKFSVLQKVSTGGQISLSTAMNRATTNSTYSSLNPDYTSNLGVEIAQPILKGAGFTVNLAAISSASSFRRQSELELRKKVLDTILETEVAFWNLAAAYEFKLLRKSNLELAKRLLDENFEKHRLGLLRKQDVIQAEANLASEEEEMILAEQLIANRTDALLSSMGELRFDGNAFFDVGALPQENLPLPNFRRVIDGAIAFDLDLQIQMEIVSRAELDRLVAEQNLNPTLNVVAGAYLNGRDGEFGGAYDSTINAKGHQWNAGLELSFPWDLREEYARDAKAAISLRQTQINMAFIQQTLMLTLRTAYRDLEAGLERKKSTEISLRLNEESFNQQKALYDSGLITFRDVMQAQRDLDLAKRRHLDAIYTIVINNAKLSRLDGSILLRHGFAWGDLKAAESVPTDVKFRRN